MTPIRAWKDCPTCGGIGWVRGICASMVRRGGKLVPCGSVMGNNEVFMDHQHDEISGKKLACLVCEAHYAAVDKAIRDERKRFTDEIQGILV